MNVNFYLEWRQGIDSHYGGLDKFDHAPTIRIMRDMLDRELTSWNKILEGVQDDEARTDAETWFTEEVDIAVDAIAEHDEWLNKRNLPL